MCCKVTYSVYLLFRIVNIFTYMYPTCAGKKLFVKHWLIPVSTKQTPAIQSGSLPVNIKGALDLMHQGGDMITKCGNITPDLHLN